MSATESAIIRVEHSGHTFLVAVIGPAAAEIRRLYDASDMDGAA